MLKKLQTAFDPEKFSEQVFAELETKIEPKAKPVSKQIPKVAKGALISKPARP